MEDNHSVILFHENHIFSLAVWAVEAREGGPILVIEEFLYVQSTVEQVIPVSVALRCVKTLGTWGRRKMKTLPDTRHLTV